MFKNKVIFLQTFPDATPEAMLQKEDMLPHNEYTDKDLQAKTFSEIFEWVERDCTYELRKDAEEKTERLTSYAIEVCREFEVDTMIIQKEHEIDVSIDLYLGWHTRSFKNAFVSMLRYADDFTLAPIKDKPEFIRFTMSYHTHDKYRHGELIE